MARRKKAQRFSEIKVQKRSLNSPIFHKVNRDALRIARRSPKRERRVFAPQDDRRIKDMLDDLYYRPERVYHTAHGTPVDVHQLPDNVNLKHRSDHIENIPRDRPSFDSNRVSICQRRQARREVIFATKRARKGANSKRHRWSALSNIICRRH